MRDRLITGRTGSGKTQSAINTITYQIFQNVPHWGGVCLDQKALYWEILVKMAAHLGRKGDLVLLQTRPLGKDELWRPVHTINITGNPNVPASTYAKVIVDTAVSLTGGRGQNPFFPTKAQIAIQTGFEVLRHMEAYVTTTPNIHRLLLNDNAAIETFINRGDQPSHELVVALRDGFFGQPPEQLGGVQGSLSTYLEFFINPEIAEVFCANEPTFSMDQIDAGKIVCIAMPQKRRRRQLAAAPGMNHDLKNRRPICVSRHGWRSIRGKPDAARGCRYKHVITLLFCRIARRGYRFRRRYAMLGRTRWSIQGQINGSNTRERLRSPKASIWRLIRWRVRVSNRWRKSFVRKELFLNMGHSLPSRHRSRCPLLSART